MMVVTRNVSQACNDKREVVPTLEQFQTLSEVLGEVQSLIADNGYSTSTFALWRALLVQVRILRSLRRIRVCGLASQRCGHRWHDQDALADTAAPPKAV